MGTTGGGSADLTNVVTETGVFQTVLEGYEAVYEALPRSETFTRIWRANAYGDAFPDEYAHLGFLTPGEADRLTELLALQADEVLVDMACGTGGPGLWLAHRTGVTLVGIDPSRAGVAAARARAERVDLARQARFHVGTFEQSGLANRSANALVTIEAFQYAPDKQAALGEFGRVLGPDGRLAVICFEVDPTKVEGIPVLGVDPVPDYRPLVERAGFVIDAYEETADWKPRVYATFGALVEAADAIVADIGDRAAAGALAEAMLTVQLTPYLRRILLGAHRSG